MLPPMSDLSFLQDIVLLLWWIFASAAVAGAAYQRGYSQGAWFLLSFALCPIFVIILLNAYPVKVAVPKTESMSISPKLD